jgi:hypothetical protein
MIYYSIPFDSDKNLANYYNRFMDVLPNADDFACFLDGDAVFTTTFFGKQLEDIVVAYPHCGVFFAKTNRVACPWQVQEGVDWRSNDMAYHRDIGAKSAKEQYDSTIVLKETHPASGVFMLVQKRTWLRVRFRGEGMVGVDNRFYNDCKSIDIEMRLMLGVYLYHWYRNGNKSDKTHLKHGCESHRFR